VIPIVQKSSDKPLASPRENSSGIAAMRALSNTALVEEAARKALSAQELEKTIERFRQLCITPGEDVRQLEEVAEILRNAGFKNELMNLLREALTLPGANPHVGALWVRRVVTSKIWDHRYPDGLDALCKVGEVGRRGVIEFLDLTATKHRSQLVKMAVARHRNWLRDHPRGWSAAGRALVQAHCYRQAARWMARWRERTDLDLKTLHCLALALRATGRMKDADEVIRVALSRPNAAESFPKFRLWVAQDQALARDTENASITFKQIDTTGWDDDSLALYYIVRGVIRTQKAEESNRHEAFEMAKERIHELFRRVPIYKRDIFLRREYRHCLTRMAIDCGEWSEGMFAVWRSAESNWFLLPLLLVPGLQLFVPCYLYRLCSRRKGVTK
jgi:hypothetical protein